jgi:hypothetical protein
MSEDADCVFQVSDCLFQALFLPAKAIEAGLAILLDVCAALYFICRYPCDTRVKQAAKGIISSGDALVDLLESIEQYVNCLDIYTRIPLTPAMVEIVLKIMAELLSTLALATRELKQGRLGEYVITDMIPYSIQHSQTREEVAWREGHRGHPGEVGPTYAR